MNENNKNKKNSSKGNKKIIILVTLLVLILLVGFIITVINYAKVKEEENKIKNRESYENAIQEVKQEILENGEILPNRYNMIERMYEGEVSTDQIYPDIYNLVMITIPDIQKRFKGKGNNEIESFYKDNKGRIEKNLGLDNKEDYLNFVNYIKELDLGEFVDSTFIEAEYKSLTDVEQVPLEIVYTKKTIKVIMEIDLKESDKNPIRFKAM